MKSRMNYIKESIQSILLELSPQTLASYHAKAIQSLGRSEHLAGLARKRQGEYLTFARTGMANSGDPISDERRAENRENAMGEHKRSERLLQTAFNRATGIGRLASRGLGNYYNTNPEAKEELSRVNREVIDQQTKDAAGGTHWNTDYGNLRGGHSPGWNNK